MSSVRKNTLVVDFSVLPVRPDAAKVQHFLENEIKLNLADVNSIQLHNTRNCVYIEMLNNEKAQQYEKTHNLQRRFVCKDKPFSIPVYVDSEAVTVRVHDLPSSISHKTITDFMKRFGDVISIQHERWKNYFPGVFNGVRVLQMRLKQSIPSFVTIESEVAMILHPNQIKSCRYCSKAVHPGQKCLEVAASKIIETATALATAPPAVDIQHFNKADFPPIGNKIIPSSSSSSDVSIESSNATSKQADPVKQQSTNDNNDDDDDGSESSASPYETNDGTYKRRLSAKRGKEQKKMCASQGSQSSSDPNAVFNFGMK